MKNEFNVKYSNRDIMDKLEKIHDQTIKTNGIVIEHTKQLIAQKLLIYGCYTFIFAIVTTTIVIIL